MSESYRFSITIERGGVQTEFKASAHCIVKPDAFNLDKEEFYLMKGHSVPQLPHYEIELHCPAVWDDPNSEKIHTCTPDNARMFLCFTGRLATINEAESIYKIWVGGTAYTMATGRDFERLFSVSAKSQPRTFFAILEKDHGIVFQSEMRAVIHSK